MKKITQRKALSKRLAQYGALTAAIAGVADASGQIIYTDVNPDEGGPGQLYLLDINNDGTDDFAIRHFNSATSSSLDNYNILACGVSYSFNAILGYDAGNYEYPFALSYGAIISGGQTSWINEGFQTMNYDSCNYSYSNWCANSGDKYLGLRFDVSGSTYYGWARIEVGATAGDWLIKDYAYNSVADQSIMAGQTLSIDEFSRNNVRIVALNKTIGLYNLPSSTDYSLFSISGQKVAQGSIANQDSYTIEAYGVSSGVYIIELVDSDTKDVLRKKIVL